MNFISNGDGKEGKKFNEPCKPDHTKKGVNPPKREKK